MKVRISPAYLGYSAGQSSRSKRRGATKTIWMTKDGLRIPIKEMTDHHLVSVVKTLRVSALKVREWAKNQAKIWRDFEKSIDDIDNWIIDIDDGKNWDFTPFEEKALEFEALSKTSIENIIKMLVPCFPMLLLEGYKRELLHSNGYPTDKGWDIIMMRKQEKDYNDA